MLALLFATQIIAGNWTYERVPDLWKEDVRTLLIAEGREDLIK
ncbi:hypothetical protein GCM10011409_38100 [Lentibacillus populi]|uniref:Uncharacterized protein n=1 Tax=Lentibacillus populi TaxID=1827502 RepID=A0A9W5X6Z5_9BACI|nr:CD1375 family protein [Lentibacillus populi]GGB56904.1 hypothetical protein GCM10011409_38100 [Lentibacillus populi]